MQTLSTASRPQILAANGDFHRTRSKEHAVTPHIWGRGAADTFLPDHRIWGVKTLI